jgi:homoserine dehydrogenase
MNSITYSIVLAGLGNVGSTVLSILHREKQSLLKRYGVKLIVIGVAEFGGGAIDKAGLDLGLLLKTLQKKDSIADLPVIGRPQMDVLTLIEQLKPDIFLEATPVNLEDAQPGLSHVQVALQKGIHTILANKGPVALAYNELASMSDLGAGWGTEYKPDFIPITGKKSIPKLRFSACVAGSLPAINMGWRDLAGCRITRMEAVFNGTTQYILREMEQGHAYKDALVDAQERGIAETDPSLDVEGWDAAAKLVITANAVLGQETQLSDVNVQGIQSLSNEIVQQALDNGQRIVLVCLAEYIDERYQLSVQPTALPLEHPLTQITADEMAVAYYTEDVERLFTASSEPGPEPAAAAMLRDILEIVHSDWEKAR